MHETAFYPGLGELPKELVPGRQTSNKVVSLTLDEPFVIAEIVGAQSRRTYTFPIPISNFKLLVLDEKVVTAPPLRKEE